MMYFCTGDFFTPPILEKMKGHIALGLFIRASDHCKFKIGL